MKRGLVFAAGVADGDGGAALRAAINRRAARRFPGLEVRWGALHSPLRTVTRAANQPIPLPQALRRMSRDGFTHVAVQPLHVVRGSEFDRLRAAVDRHQRSRYRFAHLAAGAPLLESGADAERVAMALLVGVSPLRKRGEAVIAIGHGSAAPAAGLAYLAAAWLLNSLDRLAFLGCVNGLPDLADVRQRCKAARVKRALLVPFTTAAGSTLRDALAPAGPKSWIKALAAEGIAAVALPRGLAENDAIAEVWLDHAEAAFGRHPTM